MAQSSDQLSLTGCVRPEAVLRPSDRLRSSDGLSILSCYERVRLTADRRSAQLSSALTTARLRTRGDDQPENGKGTRHRDWESLRVQGQEVMSSDEQAIVRPSVRRDMLTGSLVKMARSAERPYRIGFLGVTSASTPGALRRVEAFRAGLRALGYVEGADVLVEFRWADGDAGRLAGLARELVMLPVDMLVTQGSSGTGAAKDGTSTIPIVIWLSVMRSVPASSRASRGRAGNGYGFDVPGSANLRQAT